MTPPDIDLKDYVDLQVAALRRELVLQREADIRAMELASAGLEYRLARMNEYREQIMDERGIYVRVDTFRWTVGFLVAVCALIVAVVRMWR